VYISTYIHLSTCVCVCLSVLIYVCVCVICLSLCVCVLPDGDSYVYISTYSILDLSTCVCVCVCVFMCVYIYICLSVSVYSLMGGHTRVSSVYISTYIDLSTCPLLRVLFPSLTYFRGTNPSQPRQRSPPSTYRRTHPRSSISLG